jgi:hypothetical protein
VSSGNGGNVTLNVAGDIQIGGTSANGDLSRISTSSTGFSQLEQAKATGSAGNIQVTANSLKVTDGSVISAISDQLGKAGNININLRPLDNGKFVFGKICQG